MKSPLPASVLSGVQLLQVMPEKAGRSNVLHRSVVKPKTRMPIGLGEAS